MHNDKATGKIFMKKQQATQKHQENSMIAKDMKYSGKEEDGKQRAKKCKFSGITQKLKM